MGRSTRRGPWLPEEDATLLRLVHIQGPNNWVRISQHMQHRSPKQCRERYHQNLKSSLNHDPISPEEGEMIEQLVHEMGKRWAEIARRLGNRSDNAVKNWWNGSMNRRKRHHVHDSDSARGVGFRRDPIPLTAPLRSPNYFAQFHIGGMGHRRQLSSGSALERTRRGSDTFPTLFEHSQTDFEKHQVEDAPNPQKAHLVLPRLPLPEIRELRTLNQPWSAPGSLHNTPNPFPLRQLPSLQSPLENPIPKFETRSSCPSEWQMSRVNQPENHAISPAASEYSNPASLQHAPSLVSDNQSRLSISPRTNPSPRPTLPAPIDTHHTSAWRAHKRTHSSWSISQDGRGYNDEGYMSALPTASITDASIRRFGIEPELKSAQLHRIETPLSASLPSPSNKDNRMTVSRILG